MGYAVFHIEKGTKNKANGLGSHIDRTKNVPNADPKLTPENFRLNLENKRIEWTHKPNETRLQDRINKRISEGYKGKTAIRKDAVTHLNIVLTGSHEDMIRISEGNRLKDWAEWNLEFINNHFGKQNIVDFTMHMDERTPHIHCVVVPLTPDGRLSAKEMIGNRIELTKKQDTYAMYMAQFDLQRGIKGSKATHDSVKEYYGRINQRLEINPEAYKVREIDVDVPKIETPPLFNREDWTKRQNEAIFANFAVSLEAIQVQAKKT